MNSSHPQLPGLLAGQRAAIERYVRGIVRDPAVAEDLTQETLVRAYEKLADLEDPARLAGWLYRIATNLCHDRFRRLSRWDRPRSLDDGGAAGEEHGGLEVLQDKAPRLDKVMEQKEMSACVQQYLAELSDPYRAAILLHDVEGLTNPEIADMLHVSLATVKIRIHRAREKLRLALGSACSFTRDERGVLVCVPKPQPSED